MIGEIIFMLFLWVSGILSAIGLGFAAYYVLSAPFRRADCANLVVELNELAAATGQTPEQLFRVLSAGKISDVPYRGNFRRLHSLMQREPPPVPLVVTRGNFRCDGVGSQRMQHTTDGQVEPGSP